MRLLLFVGFLGCAPKSEGGLGGMGVSASPLRLTPLLFWEVQKGDKVSHLLGTCHIGISLDEALPLPHRNHLDRARVVVTEARMPRDPVAASELLLAETRLSSQLSPEAFHRLVSRTPAIPASLFDRSHPWGASMLSSSAGAILEGPKLSMDSEVEARGANAGAKPLYVETMEEQEAMLASLNDAYLASMEQEINLEAERASYEVLDRMCREGVIPAQQELFRADDPTGEVLLHARNRAWVPKLLPELEAGGTFVAVGAAHMVGKQGLIELLRAEGYTITQRFSERRVAEPGAYEPPPPPTRYNPGKGEVIAKHYSSVVDTACAPKGTMVQCFFDSETECREVLAVDLLLCANQHLDWPTAGVPDARQITEVTSCVLGGAIFEGVAAPIRPAPVCEVVASAVRKASLAK